MYNKKEILISVCISIFLFIFSIYGIFEGSGSYSLALFSILYVGCYKSSIGVSGLGEYERGKTLNINYKRDGYKCFVDIEFNIESRCRVRLSVYDMYGKLVKNLLNDEFAEGRHELSWKSTYHPASSGPFYYKMEAGDNIEVKKVLYS